MLLSIALAIKIFDFLRWFTLRFFHEEYNEKKTLKNYASVLDKITYNDTKGAEE